MAWSFSTNVVKNEISFFKTNIQTNKKKHSANMFPRIILFGYKNCNVVKKKTNCNMQNTRVKDHRQRNNFAFEVAQRPLGGAVALR